MDKKYIILYLALDGNDYVPSYGVALSKKDVPRIIKNAKDKVLACDFMVLELGEDVTKKKLRKSYKESLNYKVYEQRDLTNYIKWE